jgi:hypothetical protein
VVIVVVLAAIAWAVQRSNQGAASSQGVSAATNLANHPPPSAEESSHRLVPAPVPPAGEGKFEVLQHQPGQPKTPIAFDPCRPIHYVVNLGGAPSDGLTLVQGAIRTVAAATGLKFIDDGNSTETPSKDRSVYQPKRYDAARWAPVLIAWSDETKYPSLAGYIAGVGASQAAGRGGGTNQYVYVTGEVVLDEAQLSETAAPDRGEVRAIILHELGHLIGLDHTDDRRQIMFSEAQFDVHEYGAGDLRGLALLGAQACFPDV